MKPEDSPEIIDEVAERAERYKGDHWTLLTDPAEIGPAVEAFEARLVENGWDRDEDGESNMLYRRTLAFNEALVNALGHGNLDVVMEPGSDKMLIDLIKEKLEAHPELRNKKIEIDIEVTPDLISTSILDEGAGFIEADVPPPTEAERILKPSGRGLFLMRGLFDEVTHSSGGRKITLVKRRSLGTTEVSQAS